MKSLTITIFSLFLSLITYSQATRAAFEMNMVGRNGIIKSLHNVNSTLTYDDVSGSPYLNDDFSPGKIIMKDGTSYSDIPLRYNIYTDKIEFESNNNVIMEIAQPNLCERIIISNKIFVYQSYTENNSSKNGYFELIEEGNLSLLKQYQLQFKDAVEAQPYKDPKPAQFDQHSPRFFLLSDSNTAVELNSKSKTLEALEQYSPDIEKWIKKNKLKVNKEEDLIKAIQFCNQKMS